MAKRVRVQLFGLQNRNVQIDADATEGARVGVDLLWPDGSVVTEEQLKSSATSTDTETRALVDYLLAGGAGGGAIPDWPLHRFVVPNGETLLIPDEYQYLIHTELDVAGTLTVEPGGELVIFDDPPGRPFGPDLTYDIGGNLTQIDYDDGSQKLFSYNVGGDLTQLDFIQDGVTLRKEFFYTGGGDLDYITEYYV
jgi:hypothetical protein